MSGVSNTPISPKAKAAYRRQEKLLLLQLATRAESLARPGLNHAELYIGRLLLRQSMQALNDLQVER